MNSGKRKLLIYQEHHKINELINSISAHYHISNKHIIICDLISGINGNGYLEICCKSK